MVIMCYVMCKDGKSFDFILMNGFSILLCYVFAETTVAGTGIIWFNNVLGPGKLSLYR